jgi:hypothetical protein
MSGIVGWTWKKERPLVGDTAKAKDFYCIFLDCMIYNARLQWFLFRPAWLTERQFLRSKRRLTMDSQTSLSTKQRLFVISSVVLGSVLLSTAVLSSSASRRQQEMSLPTVKDNTGSFRLISLERTDHSYVMWVQNTSDKAITAYAKAVCDFPESSADYTLGDQSIAPGEVVKIDTPAKAVSDHCRSAKSQPTITILAVVFDDRTTAGEYQWAKGILDDRGGNRIQLKRINSLLRKAQKWPDAGEPAAIERLKAEIAALPVDEDEAPAVRGGLSDAKQTALYLLDELKQWHQTTLTAESMEKVPIRGELAGIKNLQEGLAKLISLNDKWISKY